MVLDPLRERGNFGVVRPIKKHCNGVYAKTAEPIEMPFRGLTHMGPWKHVLDGGQGRTNPFAAARGDKTAMWPFVKILLSLVKFSYTTAEVMK